MALGWQACLFSAVLTALVGSGSAADLIFPTTGSFAATDTLAPPEDPSTDARECLAGLVWTPAAFEVQCEPPQPQRGDVCVRFHSPIASGSERNDWVAMEWYVARDEQQRVIEGPAVVVVHESGSDMKVGRLIAWGLHLQGVHAFLIHLPHYGLRREADKRPKEGGLITAIRQAVADVRRARDAVAALPLVDTNRIALQGTSLGGFVCATTAGLDHGYDRVFLMLAGGNLYDLIQEGDRDAAKVREELGRVGLSGERLRSLLNTIEPMRVAHRIDPERTWLYSANYDTVVPPKNAQALADAARLDEAHHIRMAANHYSGIIYLPAILAQIAERTKTIPVRTP